MIYFIVLFLSMNFSMWWWMWMMVEVLNWLMMFFIYNKLMLLSFILWQSFSSLFLVFSLLLFNNMYFAILSLFFKMSLPPFHYWFWWNQYFWSWKSFLMFMCCHKYLPIMLLMNFLSNEILVYTSLIAILMFIFAWNTMNLKSLFFSSMMMDSIWMIMSMFYSMKMLLLYYVMNIFIMFVFMQMNKSNFMNLSFKSNTLLMMIPLILGLPPLSMFYIKYLILSACKYQMIMLILIFSLFMYLFMWMWFFTNISILVSSNFKLDYPYYYLWVNLMWIILL